MKVTSTGGGEVIIWCFFTDD